LLPFAFAIQETCARIALVTGTGLARVIKQRMPAWVLFVTVFLVALANTVNIAADLSSMAAVVTMFVPAPQLLVVAVIAILVGAAEILIPYHQYARVLRWLCLSLLSYVAVLVVANVDWPRFSRVNSNRCWLESIRHCGHHCHRWHHDFALSYSFGKQQKKLKNLDMPQIPLRVTFEPCVVTCLVGMFSGVFVMFAIMTTTAATLNAEGITQITSPEQAAMALAPIAGDAAGVIFALGILGTGLLAVPVLAGSTAYAVSEAMGWREGLERRPSQAKLFYAVIAVSMAIAVALNLVGINPMRSLVVAAL
jgi:Mn2+/Fe2+ NRAMP family transporter